MLFLSQKKRPVYLYPPAMKTSPGKKITALIFFILTSIGIIVAFENRKYAPAIPADAVDQIEDNITGPTTPALESISISSLKNGDYPGSEIKIEQTLNPGSNYLRYIASYKSDNLTIYALLTVPKGTRPSSGWPVIIFNHGYIPPAQYKTAERYIAYTDAFSRNGYLVFKPDYRGHGNSEGIPTGAYGSNDYTVDVLNALASIKRYSDADPDRIGMWGHSMGGFLTLRSMVVSKDIKAGVIWGGVVASYPDLISKWRRRPTPLQAPTGARRWRDLLTAEFGTPETNPEFWRSISANSFLTDISGPVALHHGEADVSVPVEFSKTLNEQLMDVGKESEVFIYAGDNHNISNNFGTAIRRSIEFFDKYLKQTP